MAASISYHDQPVTGISLQDNCLCIDFDVYDDEKGDYEPAQLLFSGIESLKINDEPNDNVQPLLKSGEVFSLQIENNEAKILIEWSDRKTRQKIYTHYEFSYTNVETKKNIPAHSLSNP